MSERKILVADDDADNRAIISTALSASGYRVCQAVDGIEAVEQALRETPDLILLDLSMPRLSGWEAAGRIKAMPQTRHIPIYAFTAHGLAGDELKAREAGCDGYISKPCIPREVVETIGRRLSAPRSNSASQLKIRPPQGGRISGALPRGEGAGSVGGGPEIVTPQEARHAPHTDH